LTFGKKRGENQINFLLDCINIYIVNRGNLMGDAGVRALTHILQTNRHLHTIYFDRNSLSLNNFEEIVNAMEEYVSIYLIVCYVYFFLLLLIIRNSVIEYLPVPITDIILMKTTEKERMEKLQFLMNKVIVNFVCLFFKFNYSS
jgi:hypothetical protein